MNWVPAALCLPPGAVSIVDFPNALHILWYRGVSGGKQLAFRPSSGVYKQYNCVSGAVITTI